MKWKKFISYYRPYVKAFLADMFFACLGAVITLIIPLIIRYITNTVIYFETAQAMSRILQLAALMVGMVLLECYCNYYIAHAGHMMGARMERDMRHEIFGHYQKLSFAYYDDQKVGQMLSLIHI